MTCQVTFYEFLSETGGFLLKFSVLFPISIIQIGQDNILRLEEVGEVLVHGLHAAGHGVRDHYGGVAWTSENGDETYYISIT